MLRRWFNKAKQEEKIEKIETQEALIERDGIAVCAETQLINNKGDEKEDATKQRYRMLAVHAKTCNKWFMMADKQRWSKDMKEDALNKHRCAIRMIADEDVVLNNNNFRLKDVTRIITGLDISSAQNELFCY